MAYSLDCAHWLAVPFMARGKVVWSQVERERTVVDANGKSHQVTYYVAYAATGGAGCGDGAAEEGYGRLTSVGPGGERGFRQPSVLHFQAGNPHSGVRMEELAMHGLRFGVKAATSLMLARGNLDSSALVGASIEGGYDLSRYIPLLDETWVKADVGFLFGSETFLPLSLSLEAVSYVANRVAVFGDIGFAWTAVSKSIDMGPVEPNATLSRATFGGRVAAVHSSSEAEHGSCPCANKRQPRWVRVIELTRLGGARPQQPPGRRYI